MRSTVALLTIAALLAWLPAAKGAEPQRTFATPEEAAEALAQSVRAGDRAAMLAVLGNDAPEASVPGEIVPAREFYDYEAKYLDEGSKTIIPADIPAALADEIRRLSIAAFQAIDCAGMARVDFLLSRTSNDIVINEINTIPGFTTISMYSKMWEASGLSYPALLDRLIELALERHGGKQQLRTSLT